MSGEAAILLPAPCPRPLAPTPARLYVAAGSFDVTLDHVDAVRCGVSLAAALEDGAIGVLACRGLRLFVRVAAARAGGATLAFDAALDECELGRLHGERPAAHIAFVSAIEPQALPLA